MTLLAMLLSTASARVLLNNPYYDDLSCEDLAICVPNDVVGNRTLTIKEQIRIGKPRLPVTPDCNPYKGPPSYCVAYEQEMLPVWDRGTPVGSDVYLEFYLNGILFHYGNYNQNFCQWTAGAIHTDDPSAVSTQGSKGGGRPGTVIVRF